MPRTFKVKAAKGNSTDTEGTNGKETPMPKTEAKAVKIDGVGKLATALLKKGHSYDDTLEIVLRVFPGAKTTKNCIYYYATKAGLTGRSKAQADKKELAKVLKSLAS